MTKQEHQTTSCAAVRSIVRLARIVSRGAAKEKAAFDALEFGHPMKIHQQSRWLSERSKRVMLMLAARNAAAVLLGVSPFSAKTRHELGVS